MQRTTTLSFAFKLQKNIQIYVFAMSLVYTQNKKTDLHETIKNFFLRVNLKILIQETDINLETIIVTLL